MVCLTEHRTRRAAAMLTKSPAKTITSCHWTTLNEASKWFVVITCFLILVLPVRPWYFVSKWLLSLLCPLGFPRRPWYTLSACKLSPIAIYRITPTTPKYLPERCSSTTIAVQPLLGTPEGVGIGVQMHGLYLHFFQCGDMLSCPPPVPVPMFV